MSSQPAAAREAPNHFIRQIVVDDRAAGRHGGRVATRFPPEPNGYLHVGHAKSICLNFGMAAEFGGVCHLRFDDTNPVKEDLEYVRSIQDDVRWLGFEWDVLLHASDYFETFYLCAEKLMRQGEAFVCDLSAEQVREYRGTLTEPGPQLAVARAPGRREPRSVRGACAPASSPMARAPCARRSTWPAATSTCATRRSTASARSRTRCTGDAWCIYPMYDYAHCISDAVEGITHSLCTLEFEDHRPLYDWFLRQLDLPGDPELTAPLRARGLAMPVSTPQQIEFSRLNLDYTVMSKRKLMALVADGLVDGWDDPRMPTLSAMRRRGFPAAAIRDLLRAPGRDQAEQRDRVRRARGLRARGTRRACAAAHGRARSAAGW